MGSSISKWEMAVLRYEYQMGDYLNMNTAFVDKKNGIVAIVDPFDSERWVEGLAEEGLRPTHGCTRIHTETMLRDIHQ